MALSQLYRRSGNSAYLTAALNVANWVVTNTYNTLGPGGYSFGTNINQFNQSVPSPNGKSTEHNIDTYAFFTMLDRLTDHGSATNGMFWKDLAAHALNFVIAMYNTTDGYFCTGALLAIRSASTFTRSRRLSDLVLFRPSQQPVQRDHRLGPRQSAGHRHTIVSRKQPHGHRILYRHGLRHRQSEHSDL